MNKLESSEFYNIRFKNFSTLIIIPSFILLISLIIFSNFIPHQNVVNSVGKIENYNGERFILYVPANNIGSINKRQKINITIPRENNTNLRLTSKVESISKHPDKNGNYLIISDKINNVNEGMSGKACIIIKKCSLFQYYLNKLIFSS